MQHTRRTWYDLHPSNIPVERGLTGVEVADVESALWFTLSPDLQSILPEGLPVWLGFSNWRLLFKIAETQSTNGGEEDDLFNWNEEKGQKSGEIWGIKSYILKSNAEISSDTLALSVGLIESGSNRY